MLSFDGSTQSFRESAAGPLIARVKPEPEFKQVPRFRSFLRRYPRPLTMGRGGILKVGDEIRPCRGLHAAGGGAVQAGQRQSRRAPPAAPMRAVVNSIHPERRFYTVRFYYRFGSFCESFPIRKKGR